MEEVAVKAVARFDVIMVCRFADSAGKFRVKKMLGEFVELHPRQAGEVHVLGRDSHCLGGQGDTCGDDHLVACGG